MKYDNIYTKLKLHTQRIPERERNIKTQTHSHRTHILKWGKMNGYEVEMFR